MALASRAPIRAGWLVELARPYLRGYEVYPHTSGGLWGYFFERPAGRIGLGFFAGFLLSPHHHAYLSVGTPACLVFAFVRPVRWPIHRGLVEAEESLFRRTASYISWLTARKPRWQFLEDKLPALSRAGSMNEWPRRRREHYARNFFTESLALLVRSGLVQELLRLSIRKSDFRQVTRTRKGAKSKNGRLSVRRNRIPI